MCVAIIFDSRTAFYVTVSMSFILAGCRGNDYFIGITMLFTGSIAAYAVKDIEDRMQIFFSVIFIFIGFVLSIFVTGLERGYTFSTMMPQILLGLINAITAPVITFFIVLILSRYNHTLINNLKLKIYIEKEHPIITELKKKAPGTFEHSREVSHLACLIAKEIGVNVILTQVGAMFHDVGKMEIPDCFTENKELYQTNIYENQFPKERANAIISHVTYGIEKLLAAKFPQPIIDFIPQHHGTYLVKHFYNVALNEANGNTDLVTESDFRYPGPTPQSKETVIVMLCDIAEAISKSVSSIDDFERIFEAEIDDRIKDGQFDKSQLSLSDIKTIRSVIHNEIKGKIHTRVQYAVVKKNEKK